MVSKKNSSHKDSGSPNTGEPVYLIVGYLRRAHGVHGEMVMQVITDFPARLKAKSKVFVGKHYHPMTVQSIRAHSEGMIIKFDEFHNPEDTANYRNQFVYVTSADRPKLPKGQFYIHELVGFDVVDEEEKSFGTLSDVLQTGANDVYVVTQPDGKEILLPVIASVVLDIDADRHVIHVHLIPGLLDESEV